MSKLIILIALCLVPCVTMAVTLRSGSAKAEYKREHPCPTTGARNGTCGGYVIDHVLPLACGGADAPSNMQWQTKEAAKALDRVK